MDNCTGLDDCPCAECAEAFAEAARLEEQADAVEAMDMMEDGQSGGEDMDVEPWENNQEDGVDNAWDEFRGAVRSNAARATYERELETSGLPARAVDGYVDWAPGPLGPDGVPPSRFVYTTPGDESGSKAKRQYRKFQDRYWQRKP